MYAVAHYLLVFTGVTLASNPLGGTLVDVSESVTAVHWSVQEGGLRLDYFHNSRNAWRFCNNTSIPPHSPDSLFKRGYTFDLKRSYQLRTVVVLTNKPVSRDNLALELYVDRVLCVDANNKGVYVSGRNISFSVDCKASRGRTVSIVSPRLDVCGVHVLVCPAGRMGEGCTETCSVSYGVSCSLPCRCHHNESCSKKTGFCRTGCANSKVKRTECSIKSVEISSKSHYTDLTHEARSVKWSSPYNEMVKSCLNLSLVDFGLTRSVWIQWEFKSRVHLRDLEVDLGANPGMSRAVVRLTIDGQQCLERAAVFRKSRYSCHGRNLSGKSIRLSFHSLMEFNSAAVGGWLGQLTACGVRLLACHPGFYGPFCRLPCNCLVLPCHPDTGSCHAGVCSPGHKGDNCAQVDVSKIGQTFISGDSGALKDLVANPADEVPIPHVFVADTPNWAVVRSIELSGTFLLNHVTAWVSSRSVSVYLDPTPGPGSAHAFSSPFKGLACVRSSLPAQSAGVRTLDCSGQAAVVTVAVFAHTRVLRDTIRDVQVWSCRDGVFGPRCQHVCHCRSPDDVCHKDTGHCASGCHPAYTGPSCQQELCPHGRCEVHCHVSRDGGATCRRACLPGWVGDACNIPCPDRLFGKSCLLACFQCASKRGERTCDSATGRCLHGCLARYEHSRLCSGQNISLLKHDDLVSTKESAQDNPTLFLIILVCIFSGLIAICILLLLARYIFLSCRRPPSNQFLFPPDAFYKRQSKDLMAARFSTMEEGWQWIAQVDTFYNIDTSLDEWTEEEQVMIRKVAVWILCQNFSELIDRRLDRLAMASEDELYMEESEYDMADTVHLSPSEIGRLYEEIR